MSDDCILIGIGGSGSKCIDNYAYLCAAGLGPKNLDLGIVDQDQPNGNVGKAKKNINNYQTLYQKFRSEGLNNISPESNFFKTHITTNQNDLHWTPLDETTDPTLKDLFSYDLLNDDLQDLMKVLYHEEKDLELSLREGFRGRPSIGTAAMISQIQSNIPFWQNVFNTINGATQGKDIRIFLISSIFGGTGAAGFPSIAKLLRTYIKDKGLEDNVFIGGSLLLPYFSFPPPEDAQDINEAASADSFLQQARGALDYYHRDFKKNEYFDELYVAGWDPLIDLGYFDSGGTNQINPPLLPELYSCLSASRFFLQDKKNLLTEDRNRKIFHICRDKENEFNWSDLPSVNENLSEVKDLLGQFTRTSVKFHYDWFKTLSTNWKSEVGNAWYGSLIKSSADLDDTNTKDLLIKLDTYFENYLHWISSMINHSKSDVNDIINLIEINQFSKFNRKNIKDGVELNKSIPSSQNFDKLVVNSRGIESAEMFIELSDYKKTKNQSGLGTFISALYHGCRSVGGN